MTRYYGTKFKWISYFVGVLVSVPINYVLLLKLQKWGYFALEDSYMISVFAAAMSIVMGFGLSFALRPFFSRFRKLSTGRSLVGSSAVGGVVDSLVKDVRRIKERKYYPSKKRKAIWTSKQKYLYTGKDIPFTERNARRKKVKTKNRSKTSLSYDNIKDAINQEKVELVISDVPCEFCGNILVSDSDYCSSCGVKT